MKLSRIFVPLVLASSVSAQALAGGDYYEPEPLPTPSSNEQNQTTNVTVTPKQIQEMSNEQIVDFVNENKFTSNQVAELQSHMSNDQRVALNNAIKTGDVTMNDGDVNTNLAIGDLTATGGTANAINEGNTNNISSNTRVQGSYSYGIATPIIATPAGECNSGFSIGLGGGNYSGNGSVGFGWQNAQDQECAEAAKKRLMERQAQMNEHAAAIQDDSQAHEVAMTAHKHNCERSPKQTVKQLSNGTTVVVQSDEPGPADKAEHIMCHTYAAEESPEYKKALAKTYTEVARVTDNGARQIGDSMNILMGLAKTYTEEEETATAEQRAQQRAACLEGVQTKAQEDKKYNAEIGKQVCMEKFPTLKH